MKKSIKLFALAILAGIAFSTTSCTKCVNCELTEVGYGVSTQWDVCGDNNGQDQAETDCENAANSSPDFTCTCTTSYSL